MTDLKYYAIFYRMQKGSEVMHATAVTYIHPLQWQLLKREDVQSSSAYIEYHILSYNEIDYDTWIYMKDQYDEI